MPSQPRHPGRRTAWSLACAATISRWTPASTSFASARVRPKSAMSTRPSGRLISTTSAHDPSPSAPISTSLKTQATYPSSVRERERKYPTAVAPPISRRSPTCASPRPTVAHLGRLRAAVHAVENAVFQTHPIIRNELGITVVLCAFAGFVYFEEERAFF